MKIRQHFQRFRREVHAIHHLLDGRFFYFGAFCMCFVGFSPRRNRAAVIGLRLRIQKKPPDRGFLLWLGTESKARRRRLRQGPPTHLSGVA